MAVGVMVVVILQGGGFLLTWNDFIQMAGSSHLHTGEPHATVSLTPDGGLRARTLE